MHSLSKLSARSVRRLPRRAELGVLRTEAAQVKSLIQAGTVYNQAGSDSVSNNVWFEVFWNFRPLILSHHQKIIVLIRYANVLQRAEHCASQMVKGKGLMSDNNSGRPGRIPVPQRLQQSDGEVVNSSSLADLEVSGEIKV
jgi:hypothetical protein